MNAWKHSESILHQTNCHHKISFKRNYSSRIFKMSSDNEKVFLEKFKFEKVLNSSESEKTLALLGEIDGKNAIIRLEKTNYNIANIDHSRKKLDSFFNEILNVDIKQAIKTFHNGIYSRYQVLLTDKINVIWPATDKHIRKYDKDEYVMIKETGDMYFNKFKPYILPKLKEENQWIYNILHKGYEKENLLLFIKDKFVLVKDLKWDGLQISGLYYTCILFRSDILTVRELTMKDRNWLIEYKTRIENCLIQKFSKTHSLKKEDLRMFIHYHPTYYQFHIHVTSVMNEGLGGGILAGKAILLDEVIENLKYCDYKDRDMTFIVSKRSDLYRIYFAKDNESQITEEKKNKRIKLN